MEASIPVDLFNPGHVFACLGFLEAAEVLLGHAEGGFDWSRDAEPPRFKLRGDGERNPFQVTLEFLDRASLQCLAPRSYIERGSKTEDDLREIEAFPAAEAETMTLPVRLQHDKHQLDLTCWCDGSSRKAFKLFAGKQRGPAIARQMIEDIRTLSRHRPKDVLEDPFGSTMPLGGSSFKLDARKGWTTIGVGYSPDKQDHKVEASPIVELLAALGLEHARPVETEPPKLRYAAWKGLLPPVLARPALGGMRVGVPIRVFCCALEAAGKNKVVTFAREETNP